MGERSINVKAVRSTGGEWVPEDIYSCTFRKREGVGCESAEIRVPNAGDLPQQLDMLQIFEDLTLLWYGRIEDKPEISLTGEVTITAIGYNSQLKDDQIKKLWSDQTFDNWDVTPPVEPKIADEWELAERDNNHRLFIRSPKDVQIVLSVVSGLYYRLTNTDAIDQSLHSWVIEYNLGDDFDSSNWFIKSNEYDQDFSGGALGFTITGAGPRGKTTESRTIASGKKAIHLVMQGNSTYTPSTNLEFFRATSVRVNGDSAFTGDYTYKEIIDDIITNFATGISTDFSKIAAGVVNIDTFYAADPTFLADIITMASSGEDVSMGFYDLDSAGIPRFQAEAINRSTVNWIAFQDEAKLNLSGPSIQEMFNRVRVVFDRKGEDGKRSILWTVADAGLTDPAPLANAGITRTDVIDVPTSSLARAKNTATSFLTEAIKEKARGDTEISNDILNTSRGKVSPVSMNPNEIIQFADVDVSPQTLTDLAAESKLNGRNVFRVTAVDVDAINKNVIATLDIEGDRLDVEISDKDSF